ncbi:hypothetical protein [Muricoccus radiodurans]|uniref:hypothetical protein n=1 Tax=Muricoccus radiodurans TaxID=2231721 RepID=UPI003CF748A5
MSAITNWAGLPAQGQLHGNACWAACLSWWLKAMRGGRPVWDQKTIMKEYWRSIDDNGAMRPEYMVNSWCNDTRLKMSTCLWPTPDPDLYSLPLGSTPVCIAFKHITGFAHMNVIFEQSGGFVWAMEPYFPFPGQDGKRTGRIVKREIGDYNFGDNVVLGWGRPADGRDTKRPDEAG